LIKHLPGTIAAVWTALVVPAVATPQDAGVVVEGQLAAAQSAPSTGRLSASPYVDIGRAGAWGFVYVEDGYVSGVGGPYVALHKKGTTVLDAGVGAGLAHAADDASYAHAPRYAAFVSLSGAMGEAGIYYENGRPRAPWVQADATVNVRSALAVGVFHQTGDGTGPRALVSIPRTHLKVWAGPMFEPGQGSRVRTAWLAGCDLTFER